MENKGVLYRQYFDKYTKGELILPNFKCFTLELPYLNNVALISCFEEGVYNVIPRYSKKYGNHLYITGTPKRDLCLIHWGNYAASKNPKSGHPDIKGCVLTGFKYSDLDGDGLPEIIDSRAAFKALMKAYPEGFELTVRKL
jgi:hypothetical protein